MASFLQKLFFLNVVMVCFSLQKVMGGKESKVHPEPLYHRHKQKVESLQTRYLCLKPKIERLKVTECELNNFFHDLTSEFFLLFQRDTLFYIAKSKASKKDSSGLQEKIIQGNNAFITQFPFFAQVKDDVDSLFTTQRKYREGSMHEKCSKVESVIL